MRTPTGRASSHIAETSADPLDDRFSHHWGGFYVSALTPAICMAERWIIISLRERLSCLFYDCKDALPAMPRSRSGRGQDN